MANNRSKKLDKAFIACLICIVTGLDYPSNRECTAVNSTALTLTWTQASDTSVSGYHLDLARSDGLKVETPISIVLADRTYETYTFNGLGEYGTYTITIHSYFASGANGTDYAQTCITDPSNPDASNYNFTCVGISYTEITCSWQNVSQVYWNGILEGYQLQYFSFVNDYYRYINLSLSLSSYTIPGLVFDTWYIFHLRAFNQVGLSPYTSYTAKTLGFTVVNVTEARYYCNEAVPGTFEFGWKEMPCTIYVGTILGLLLLTFILGFICCCQCICKGNKKTNSTEINIFNDEDTNEYSEKDDNSDNDGEESDSERVSPASPSNDDAGDSGSDYREELDADIEEDEIEQNKSSRIATAVSTRAGTDNGSARSSRIESAVSTHVGTDYGSASDSDGISLDTLDIINVGIVNTVNKSDKGQEKGIRNKSVVKHPQPEVKLDKSTPNKPNQSLKKDNKKIKGAVSDNKLAKHKKEHTQSKEQGGNDSDSDGTEFYEDWNPDAEENPDINVTKIPNEGIKEPRGKSPRPKSTEIKGNENIVNSKRDGVDSKMNKGAGGNEIDLHQNKQAFAKPHIEMAKQIKQPMSRQVTIEIVSEEAHQDSKSDETVKSISRHESTSKLNIGTKEPHQLQHVGDTDNCVKGTSEQAKYKQATVNNDSQTTGQIDDDWSEETPLPKQSEMQGLGKVSVLGKLSSNYADNCNSEIKTPIVADYIQQNDSNKGVGDISDWDYDNNDNVNNVPVVKRDFVSPARRRNNVSHPGEYYVGHTNNAVSLDVGTNDYDNVSGASRLRLHDSLGNAPTSNGRNQAKFGKSNGNCNTKEASHQKFVETKPILENDNTLANKNDTIVNKSIPGQKKAEAIYQQRPNSLTQKQGKHGSLDKQTLPQQSGRITRASSDITPLNDKVEPQDNKTNQAGKTHGNKQQHAWIEHADTSGVNKGGKLGGKRTQVQEMIPVKEAEPVFETNRLGKKYPFLQIPDQTETTSINTISKGSKSKVLAFIPASKPSQIHTEPSTSVKASADGGKVMYGFGMGRWRAVAAAWLNKWKMKKEPVKTAKSSWE